MKRVFNLIIADESGSMCVIEKQALAGLNETLETVKKMRQVHPDMEQRVSLITFDSAHCRYIFDNVAAERTHTLASKDYNPGGGTPLYDAIGTGISKLNAQTRADDHVLVTIITDGEENCSQEYNLKMIKTLIEKMKSQGWTFTLIGTDNLDVEGMAGSMAIDNHLAFAENPAATMAMFAEEREARIRYNCNVSDGNPMTKGGYFDRKNGNK